MLQITVNGAGGPRCRVEASVDWTLRKVQNAIFQKIGVAAERQILLKGTYELPPEVELSSIVNPSTPNELVLTLIEDPVTEAELGAAFEAVLHIPVRGVPDQEKVNHVLELVERCRAKTLNSRMPARTPYSGLTYLQAVAITRDDLQAIGCAFLKRHDFTLVNDKPGLGTVALVQLLGLFGSKRKGVEDGTALHLAAARGHAELCRAIIEREDFVELDARWSGTDRDEVNGWLPIHLPAGDTAADVARRCGHHQIHRMLVDAMEARAQALNVEVTAAGSDGTPLGS